MDKRLIMTAIAAGMNPLHGLDENTQEFKLGKGSTPNKYEPKSIKHIIVLVYYVKCGYNRHSHFSL